MGDAEAIRQQGIPDELDLSPELNNPLGRWLIDKSRKKEVYLRITGIEDRDIFELSPLTDLTSTVEFEDFLEEFDRGITGTEEPTHSDKGHTISDGKEMPVKLYFFRPVSEGKKRVVRVYPSKDHVDAIHEIRSLKYFLNNPSITLSTGTREEFESKIAELKEKYSQVRQ